MSWSLKQVLNEVVPCLLRNPEEYTIHIHPEDDEANWRQLMDDLQSQGIGKNTNITIVKGAPTAEDTAGMTVEVEGKEGVPDRYVEYRERTD